MHAHHFALLQIRRIMEIEEMGATCGEERTEEYVDADMEVEGTEVAKLEKIFVSVRLRPLNDREIKENDSSEWECVSDTTIRFRNNLGERSNAPTSYTFDRVFGSESSTKEVYEEAVKEIALSVINGINSTIFAYGQTSSGKTYTMHGVTQYAMEDIFDYIKRHDEREYILKFSALEIYNEVVRDLLSMDNTPLRVRDDPEKVTVVEKLTEVLLRDWNHLKELLAVCEAQRQIVETLLNESSSRSHQILKLTIESSSHEFVDVGSSNALTATLNFVDLAGSERASQALSVGNRLIEGGYINKSLLSLSTVIRKLSNGKHGHIPYRDSKLTRILQPSLGGNARTTVICTICPGRTNIEQSRRTLLFASCAKEVVTQARVNVVRFNKPLVKDLRREHSSLEDELMHQKLRSTKSHYETLLKEKDAQIEKMENEIKGLMYQRDLYQELVEDLLRTRGKRQDHSSTTPKEDKVEPVSYQNENYMHTEDTKTCISDDDSEVQCKILGCIGIDDKAECEQQIPSSSYVPVEQLIKNLEEMHNNFVKPYSNSRFCEEESNHGIPLNGSDEGCSGRIKTFQRISATLNSESEVANSFSDDCRNSESEVATSSRDEYRNSESEIATSSRDEYRNSYRSTAFEEESDTSEFKEVVIPDIDDFVADLKMASFHYQGELDVQDTETDTQETTTRILNDQTVDSIESPSRWSLEFKKKQQEIINLWNVCSVSLVHRTYFFLLFKGDPADSIYMEVELRRLSFLKKSFCQAIAGTKASEGGLSVTMASSNRKLARERAMLCWQMAMKLSPEERESLYNKWGIALNSKQRKRQLVEKLWTKTEDHEHIRESAYIVGKLMGLDVSGHALKEMFGLSIEPEQHRSLRKKLSDLKRMALSLIKRKARRPD